jgi:hypothetical protein
MSPLSAYADFMAKTADSSKTRSAPKTRVIGGYEVKPVKPVTKIPAETAARIREAVRSVYGEKKKA